MNFLLEKANQICDYQKLERQLFKLDNFSPSHAAFPNQVFNKNFDKFYFLEFNDWFQSKEDYDKLIVLAQKAGTESIISSCPPFYLMNAIEFPLNTTHLDYINNHTYLTNEENVFKGIGLRVSPEVFYYDRTKKWAMLSDITHNILIVGLQNELIETFKECFEHRFISIENFVADLEEFKGDKITTRNKIIDTYT